LLKKFACSAVITLLFNFAIAQTVDQQITPEEAARIFQQQQQQQQGVRITNDNSSIENSGRPVPQGAGDQSTRTSQNAVPLRSRPVEPPEDNEFQNFVAQSLGQKLPIFGQSLFAEVPSTFAPIDRVPVSATYVIGPGDELLVRAWGSIDIDYRAVVDRNGNIYLPRVGTVSVAGLQYQQLQPYLKSAVGRFFRNFDLSVNIGQLRSIQIFVVGQARHPGSYTVSSLSTLVNAVFASGGPLSKGSMRHIQLKRENRVVTDFDLYDLILHGDKSKDIQLLPGDVIYFGPVGPLAALFGSVNTPAIYELKENTPLSEAIQYAGGLTPTAESGKAIVERINERKERAAAEIPLDPQGLTQPLHDGDIVRFIPISPRFDNAVTLRGNVALPGRYPWHQGMRIRDLIPNKDTLIVRSYWENQNALVKAPVQITDPTKRTDRSPEHGNQPLPSGAAQAGAEVNASGREPSAAGPATGERDVSQRVNQESITTEVKRNAPEINWDYAVIQRLNRDDLTTRLIPFNLGKVVLEADESNNLELQAGDVVTIFSQADLQVPLAKQSKFVKLEGEFRAAGIYRLEPAESLHHLVARAGGLTENAYLFGAQFTRESTRQDQQKRLDQYIVQLQRSIERNSLVASNRAPSAEEAAALRAVLENQRRLLDMLRQTGATGRIVLSLKPTDNSIVSLPDIPLEDGDTLIVPYAPSTVQIIGTVYNQGAFIQTQGRRLKDYLRQSGGPTKDADKSQIFVIRADGSVLSNRGNSAFSGGISDLRMMPGDTIVVPENLTKGAGMRNLKDIAYILGQFGLAAAAINVLR
jgi:polysaccharide biosynthesis/export protein